MKKTILCCLTLAAFSAGYALAGDAKAGQAAYDKSCKGCHGATGVANPAVAKMLSATIPDLGSGEVQGLSDADIQKIISDGKGKMKPVKTLSAAPDDVVAYIRTLKK